MGYSKDQFGEIIGICSACSGNAPNITKTNIKNEMEEPYESLTEADLKHESEEVQEDWKSDKDDGDNWSEYYEPDTETNMEEDHKNVTEEESETDEDQVLNAGDEVNDSAKFKEYNEAYWQNIRNQPSDSQDMHIADHGV